MLLSNSLLLALFTTFTFAQDIKKNQYCFDTCYEAYGYTLFAGDNPELYYYSACQYPPKVLSIYAAATVYCTPSEIEAGIPKLQGYCKEYGPDLELLPISDFAANLTDAAIKKLPIVSYDEAVAAAEPYNHSVIISQSFFDIMYKTVDVWEYELWTHSTYGSVYPSAREKKLSSLLMSFQLRDVRLLGGASPHRHGHKCIRCLCRTTFRTVSS